jgi:glyoxylase-like metal-dependent hydrolase (beta-lactamase superfamily II)
MRKIDLGGLALIALTDAQPAPADWTYAFARHAEEVDAPARLRWAPDGLFRTRFTVHALVQDGRATLIDAGLGPGPHAYFDGLGGHLDREMAAAGLAPEMIDCVMFTHFHLDHIGWASRDGVPFFPHARYVAPAAELDHWRAKAGPAALPHHVAAFARSLQPLISRGMIQGLEPGEPAPSPIALSYRALPGHTAGHCAVILEGASRPLAVAGDTWHSPAQVERPDWGHRADRDPEAAVLSRTRFAQWAHEAGALVAAGHFPEEQGFGEIEATGESLRWRPLG